MSKKHRKRFSELTDEQLVQRIQELTDMMNNGNKSHSLKASIRKGIDQLSSRQAKLLKIRQSQYK